jgi:hypothetical protein
VNTTIYICIYRVSVNGYARNRYGETFKTSLLGRPMVVLASPAGNKAVFTHADVAWPASAVAVAGPASLIGQAGPGAERVCAALLAFLRPDALQHYTGPIEAIIGSFVEEHLLHQVCIRIRILRYFESIDREYESDRVWKEMNSEIRMFAVLR